MTTVASWIEFGSCARSGKAVDRFVAEARAKDELFAAAGGRVDGLDGMVAERIATRPHLQRFRCRRPS